MRLHPEPFRMHVGTSAREKYAIDSLQQLADVCDIRQARKHQRQRVGHLRYGAQVSFSYKLHSKALVHQVRIADDANHWHGHGLPLVFRARAERNCPASRHAASDLVCRTPSSSDGGPC
jgi:hypothetical protein